MRVTPGSVTLKKDEEKTFKAEVHTKPFAVKGDTSFGDFVEVSTRSETTWSSDNKAVATVDANGRVHAVSKGTAKITAVWKSGLY
ncbi:Ig-like domain-containing protein, partial [Klebsiella pneumoniae]